MDILVYRRGILRLCNTTDEFLANCETQIDKKWFHHNWIGGFFSCLRERSLKYRYQIGCVSIKCRRKNTSFAKIQRHGNSDLKVDSVDASRLFSSDVNWWSGWSQVLTNEGNGFFKSPLSSWFAVKKMVSELNWLPRSLFSVPVLRRRENASESDLIKSEPYLAQIQDCDPWKRFLFFLSFSGGTCNSSAPASILG